MNAGARAVLEQIGSFIEDYHINAFAGLLSLLVAVFGFGLTLWMVWRSKRAAEAAESAVKGVIVRLTRLDAAAECSNAIGILEELRRLQRAKYWDILPDRYSALKRSLVTIRTGCPDLSAYHSSKIQNTITHLTIIENEIEKMLEVGSEKGKVSRWNRILAKQVEPLTELLNNIRSQAGR